MKVKRMIGLGAVVAVLVCALVWGPAGAAAAGRTNAPIQHAAVTAAAPNGTGETDNGPPFSKKDLMALVAGATCLVALGIGFRRLSAPLD